MILIDAQAFEHPIPLEMAVDAFKQLKNSDVIHFIHKREPLPLFEIIMKNGGVYLSRQSADGIWHILITRNPSLDLEQYHV